MSTRQHDADKFSPRMWRRTVLGLIGGCILLTAGAGCGGNPRHGYITHDEVLVPVSGRVMFEGQPAKNATVVFHRKRAPGADPKSADAPLNPRGECNERGEFEIYTYAVDDGAPPGEYHVTVSWRDPEGAGREETYPELLPKHFQDPASSGLIVRINEDEDNNLKPFELKNGLYATTD